MFPLRRCVLHVLLFRFWAILVFRLSLLVPLFLFWVIPYIWVALAGLRRTTISLLINPYILVAMEGLRCDTSFLNNPLHLGCVSRRALR